LNCGGLLEGHTGKIPHLDEFTSEAIKGRKPLQCVI
jgi:hypothetical protein